MRRKRSVVTIENPVITRSASAQPVESWESFATDIRANIVPVTGREWFDADQRQTTVTAKIYIRYLADVEPKMRVNDGGTTYNITAVLPGATIRDDITLMCERAK